MSLVERGVSEMADEALREIMLGRGPSTFVTIALAQEVVRLTRASTQSAHESEGSTA
jgi:Mg2+/Co2+ transporter CorC